MAVSDEYTIREPGTCGHHHGYEVTKENEEKARRYLASRACEACRARDVLIFALWNGWWDLDELYRPVEQWAQNAIYQGGEPMKLVADVLKAGFTAVGLSPLKQEEDAGL